MSTLPWSEEGAPRSTILIPAIVTALLVVTVVPAAFLLLRRRKDRRETDERIARAVEEAELAKEEHPTSREAYVDAIREMEATLRP